jgi:phosphoserine phosphatase
MTQNAVIQSPALDQQLIEQAAATAQANGVQRISKSAARLLDVAQDTETLKALRQWGQARSIDIAMIEPGTKLSDCKVLAMDMDSTLINIECIDEMAAFGGVKAEVSAITEAAMRGEINDFADSLTRRVAYLKGLSVDVLQSVYEEKLRLNPGAETLVQTALQQGIKVLLVSGGFTFFTDKLGARLNLTHTLANVLETDGNGHLTGRVVGHIIDAQGKADALKAFATLHGATPAQTIAIGDGANDLKMLSLAHYSVAYRAKPIVQAQARFALNVSPLDAVLNWFDGA